MCVTVGGNSDSWDSVHVFQYLPCMHHVSIRYMRQQQVTAAMAAAPKPPGDQVQLPLFLLRKATVLLLLSIVQDDAVLAAHDYLAQGGSVNDLAPKVGWVQELLPKVRACCNDCLHSRNRNDRCNATMPSHLVCAVGSCAVSV